MFWSGTCCLIVNILATFVPDNAVVLPLVRFDQEEGVQIHFAALPRPLFQREIDSRSAERRFVQWTWNDPRSVAGRCGKT